MGVVYKTKNSASGDTLSFYNDGLSTTWSIENIKNELSRSVIRPRFRLHWLNEDETVRGTLPQEDITGGSYNENYQNGQRRSLSVTLFNPTGKYTPSINGIWAGSKFSFEVGIELSDGSTMWFPKGIYVVTSASVSRSSGVLTTNMELSDKYSVLEGALGTLETTYTIQPGEVIEDVIGDILLLSKGNGESLDPKPFIYNSAFKGKLTQATITKEAGGNIGEIITELATQLSAEVFYDTEGQLNFVPTNDVTDDVDKPVIYQIYDEYGDFASNDFSFDLNGIINRVIVVGSSLNEGVCEAVAVNDDPSSPLCYQRIGYRTGSPVNDTNITSDILAQERAEYELRQQLILKASVNISTMFNPLLLVNNMIGVTDEFYGLQQEKFLIQSLSYSLDYSGLMSVSCTNARNLPFVIGG